jgi:hypothetical protein
VGSGPGRRARVTSKPRPPSLPTVGDLAADVALALVVVGAEVLVARAGVRQQRVVDLQLGVAQRDLGSGRAAAAGQPPVAGAFAGLGLAGRDGGLAGDGGQVPAQVPARACPETGSRREPCASAV